MRKLIDRVLDYFTMRFPRFYEFRRKWCKAHHGWIQKTLVDGQVWERNECLRCGFWEDCG